mmetsp:Transcript_17810/g.44544  ORF Transcript_17810/g.44544 Transcript_17810/m.44544 type:complete len:574 (-) Transcript_17810:156-1877(-)
MVEALLRRVLENVTKGAESVEDAASGIAHAVSWVLIVASFTATGYYQFRLQRMLRFLLGARLFFPIAMFAFRYERVSSSVRDYTSILYRETACRVDPVLAVLDNFGSNLTSDQFDKAKILKAAAELHDYNLGRAIQGAVGEAWAAVVRGAESVVLGISYKSVESWRNKKSKDRDGPTAAGTTARVGVEDADGRDASDHSSYRFSTKGAAADGGFLDVLFDRRDRCRSYRGPSEGYWRRRRARRSGSRKSSRLKEQSYALPLILDAYNVRKQNSYGTWRYVYTDEDSFYAFGCAVSVFLAVQFGLRCRRAAEPFAWWLAAGHALCFRGFAAFQASGVWRHAWAASLKFLSKDADEELWCFLLWYGACTCLWHFVLFAAHGTKFFSTKREERAQLALFQRRREAEDADLATYGIRKKRKKRGSETRKSGRTAATEQGDGGNSKREGSPASSSSEDEESSSGDEGGDGRSLEAATRNKGGGCYGCGCGVQMDHAGGKLKSSSSTDTGGLLEAAGRSQQVEDHDALAAWAGEGFLLDGDEGLPPRTAVEAGSWSCDELPRAEVTPPLLESVSDDEED